MAYRAGDIICYKPTGHSLAVAAVCSDQLLIVGDEERSVAVADCDPIRTASDEEHRRFILGWVSKQAPIPLDRRTALNRLVAVQLGLAFYDVETYPRCGGRAEVREWYLTSAAQLEIGG